MGHGLMLLAHDPPTSFWFQPINCEKRAIFSVVYFPYLTLFESIPITWREEIAVRNVKFTKFSFISRTLKKNVIRILRHNDVNFTFQLFHRKLATAENTDQAACVY